MPRKKSESVTTVPRYMGKMRRIGEAVVGDPTIATLYALSLTAAQRAGYGKYKDAWVRVKEQLAKEPIPSALYGLIKAATNEYLNKVLTKKEMSPDDWRAKWSPVIGDRACDIVEEVLTGRPATARPAEASPVKG